MKRSHPALTLAVAVALLAGAPGCNDDDENPVVPQGPSRASIEALLTEFFEVAYQSKDGALYAEMLSPDFEFEFLQADAESLQDRGIIPAGQAWWNRDADLGSTNRMFGSANVGGIALNITIESIGPDSAGTQLVATSVDLSVTTRPSDPDPLNLVVRSKQSFLVGKDPADAAKWVVVRQIDSDVPAKDGAAGATEPTTWGSIKGIY
jgi:hypothetical protein